MNKTELITEVAKETDSTKKDAKVIVDTVFEVIQNELTEGNDVSILGFGNFKVKERSARKGRNPQTNEELTIPAQKAIKFTAGKNLKDTVRNS